MSIMKPHCFFRRAVARVGVDDAVQIHRGAIAGQDSERECPVSRSAPKLIQCVLVFRMHTILPESFAIPLVPWKTEHSLGLGTHVREPAHLRIQLPGNRSGGFGGLAIPLGASVFEVTDLFLLLGIDTDDG